MKSTRLVTAMFAILFSTICCGSAYSEITKLSMSEMENILGKLECSECIPGKVECFGVIGGGSVCSTGSTGIGGLIPMITCIDNTCAGQNPNPTITNGRCAGFVTDTDCEVPALPDTTLARKCKTVCRPAIAGICACLVVNDINGTGITLPWKDCIETSR